MFVLDECIYRGVAGQVLNKHKRDYKIDMKLLRDNCKPLEKGIEKCSTIET